MARGKCTANTPMGIYPKRTLREHQEMLRNEESLTASHASQDASDSESESFSESEHPVPTGTKKKTDEDVEKSAKKNAAAGPACVDTEESDSEEKGMDEKGMDEKGMDKNEDKNDTYFGKGHEVEASHIFDIRTTGHGYCKFTIHPLHVSRLIYHASREQNQYEFRAGPGAVPVSVWQVSHDGLKRTSAWPMKLSSL